MGPWTFSVKFPYGTQFIFGSLMFAAGENGILELHARGQRESIWHRCMDKLHISQLVHLHQATILPHRNDITRVPYRGEHLPAFGWDSELIIIRSSSLSGLY
jgi:hypothetical protein